MTRAWLALVAAVVVTAGLRAQWVRALPWLGFFLLGWGAGEARGYWGSLVGR